MKAQPITFDTAMLGLLASQGLGLVLGAHIVKLWWGL